MGGCCSTEAPEPAASAAPAKQSGQTIGVAGTAAQPTRIAMSSPPVREQDLYAGQSETLPPAYSAVPGIPGPSDSPAQLQSQPSDANPFTQPGGVKGVDLKFTPPKDDFPAQVPNLSSSSGKKAPKKPEDPTGGLTEPFDLAVLKNDMFEYSSYSPSQIASAISSLKSDGKWYGGPKNFFSPPGVDIKDWQEGLEGVDLDTAAVAVSRRLDGADQWDDVPVSPTNEVPASGMSYGTEEVEPDPDYSDPYANVSRKPKATVIIGPGVIFRGNVEVNGDVQMKGKVIMDGEKGALEVMHPDMAELPQV